MEHFHQQLEALRKSARQFYAAADTFSAAAGTVGRLGIAKEVFTGPGEVMATAYEKYRKQMYDVLESCDATLSGTAMALLDIAANSKTVDDDIAAAMAKGLPTN